MFEIDIIQRNGADLVDSKLLHKILEVKSYHSDWIRRRIDNYGFIEGKDYHCLKLKNEKQKGRGGHNAKLYYLTLDMAKELSMVENNDIGRKARRYFIETEKGLNKQRLLRLATKEVRKTLTDKVRDSGEQERMHNRGFSNYTLLVYDLIGIKQDYKSYKKDNPGSTEFRDTLDPEVLKRVETVESMVKSLLDLNRQYSEIKETLSPIFAPVRSEIKEGQE